MIFLLKKIYNLLTNNYHVISIHDLCWQNFFTATIRLDPEWYLFTTRPMDLVNSYLKPYDALYKEGGFIQFETEEGYLEFVMEWS